MDKNLVKKLKERSKGLCELCYSPGQHFHHIVGGNGKRKQHERIESLIYLCWDCHFGTEGIHGRDGHKLDLRLKRDLQDKYKEMGMSEEDIRYWMGGKLYV